MEKGLRDKQTVVDKLSENNNNNNNGTNSTLNHRSSLNSSLNSSSGTLPVDNNPTTADELISAVNGTYLLHFCRPFLIFSFSINFVFLFFFFFFFFLLPYPFYFPSHHT